MIRGVALRRELARLQVPTVSPDCEDRSYKLTPEEMHLQADNAEVQRTSMKLAHLYRRNVVVDHRIPFGHFAIIDQEGRPQAGVGIPSRERIERAPYRILYLAENIAQAVLRRDSQESGA
jgi:hypothetical protein